MYKTKVHIDRIVAAAAKDVPAVVTEATSEVKAKQHNRAITIFTDIQQVEGRRTGKTE